MENNLSGAQQENLLTLACFDPKHAFMIRSTVPEELFENALYRDIAREAYSFLDRFNEPVGEHLADLFDRELAASDRKAKLLARVLKGLHSLKGRVNEKYVIDELRGFVRRQSLKQTVIQASQALQEGKDDLAEELLQGQFRQTSLSVFDPGLSLYKDTVSKALSFIREPIDFLSLGVPYFDRIKLGPTRKELMVILAPTGRGKSWFLFHVGKRAVLRRLNVLHVTLEMSQERCLQRYMQALFSISYREEALRVPQVVSNEKGAFVDVESKRITRPSIANPKDAERYLIKRLAKWRSKLRLVIKEFPMNTLTISGLRAYLDQLEHMEQFIPDLLIIDYADLMHVDAATLRLDISAIYKDLRALAVTRNIPVVTASPGNRSSETARVVSLQHSGEDYSKTLTADVILTYSQSEQEKELGLCRVFVAKNRNEESHATLVMAQSYPMGQFHLSSARLSSSYWRILGKDESEGTGMLENRKVTENRKTDR